MYGKIVKGIAGFYYVHVAESGIYECKAKGIFRKDKRKPLVGDDVELDVLDETGKKGNIIQMLPRKNQLVRPEVANVDQALVIFAMCKPQPNLGLLDRFLIMMQRQQTDTVGRTGTVGRDLWKKRLPSAFFERAYGRGPG